MGRAFEFRKERKFKRWAKMSKAFTKIGKEIAVSVKEGGPDPSNNSRLRAAIQNAKAVNMPKDNIQRAIKKASSKEQGDFKELVYEGYAKHGIAVIIETATDNPTRTVADVRSYFNKTGGNLGTSGSVEFLFDRKCHFKINKDSHDLEELELELIDFGVEDVFEEDSFIMIYGDFPNFGSIQKAIEDMGLEIVESGFERIPHVTKQLTEKQQKDIEKLIDKLDDNDDVQEVYHDMA